MSLAQITEKIKAEAQLEADRIFADAKEKASIAAKKAEETCREIKADFEARFAKEKPEIFRRREIVAKLDANKLLLKAKRDLISDVYAAALEELQALPKEQYLALCEKLLKEADAKEGRLQLSRGEKYIDKAWLDEYNAKNGAKLEISEEPADICGGFILENASILTNCSWDMLIQIAGEQRETDVIGRLFAQ